MKQIILILIFTLIITEVTFTQTTQAKTYIERDKLTKEEINFLQQIDKNLTALKNCFSENTFLCNIKILNYIWHVFTTKVFRSI